MSRYSTRHLLAVISYSVRAELRSEVSRAYLGMAWWILEPAVYLSVLYFVFAIVLERGGPGYAPVLLVGLVFWRWFDSTVKASMVSISQNSRLMQQVYLPKLVFPVISTLTGTTKFLIILGLLIVFLLLAGHPPTASWFWLPLLLALEFVLILSVGSLVAMVVPFIPDMRIVVNNVMVLLLFLSGIFYTAERVPAQWRELFFANPMAVLIDSFRRILLQDQAPEWRRILIVVAITAVIAFIVRAMFRRFDLVYPKL